LARFKADVLNEFVRQNALSSVVEFGCGDGSQLALCQYPKYLGLDVSPAAVDLCRRRFSGDSSKSFAVLGTVDPDGYDAALSLDVIYHLVEGEAFEKHMSDLFDSARRLVVIYSSNCTDAQPAPHVRHRKFTDWIEQHRPNWVLSGVIRNKYPYVGRNEDETSFADFYFFKNAMAR
jgi:SAM-dependent methyltransferase